jgi:hypothetical protein
MTVQAVGKLPLLTRKIRLGDLQVPAPGGRITFPIDIAKNVHAIHLYWTVAGVAATYAEMITDVGDIRVRVGGKLVYDMNGTEILDDLHYYTDKDGVLVDAGCMSLELTPQIGLDGDTRKAYAIGMLSDTDRSKRNTMTVEVNMLAPGGGLTVDACEVQLEYDDEPADSIGYHVRTLKYGTTWAAASQQTLDQIAIESNALAVLAYHIPTTGTLTRVALNVNDNEVISDIPVDLLNRDLQNAGRTPQAGYFYIDFTTKNDPKAFLDVSRLINQYLRLTWGVAPTGYNIIVKQLCKNLS